MMKSFVPTDRHISFMDGVKGVLAQHTDLDAMQMLALASQLVGNLIALQDQRTVTPDMAMALVAENIREGNRQAILTHLGKPEGAA